MLQINHSYSRPQVDAEVCRMIAAIMTALGVDIVDIPASVMEGARGAAVSLSHAPSGHIRIQIEDR